MCALGATGSGRPPAGSSLSRQPLQAIVVPRIADVSPTVGGFPVQLQHSVSGRMLSLAVSLLGDRLYAGTVSGVWRSDDGGTNWFQLVRPQPLPSETDVIGALGGPDVYDLAVSPLDKDVVFAATGGDTHVTLRNGVYRSLNGGSIWRLVHRFECSDGGPVGQVVLAPDNPRLVY